MLFILFWKENLRDVGQNSADSEWGIRVMGTSPVTDSVEIEKGDVLQIDFNILPLLYLLYLSSIQKKEGVREVALERRATASTITSIQE